MNRARLIFITFVFGAFLSGAANLAIAGDPLKIGFVYIGPISDHGWTYQHDVARRAIEEKFGDQVKTSYVESVPEGADSERVIRQLAVSGNELIFTTSFGYMNPTIRVARRFPKVKFEQGTGYKTAPNVSTYLARFYEGRYVTGTLAGKMSKSGVIGYIGSFPIPEVIRGINAFTLALRRINPEAVVKVIWVNSWYDPGKEGDAAKTLIDQGADIIVQHTDSPAPLQVAQQRGVWGIGQASDMSAYAPEAQLTAVINNWSDYYIDRTQAVLDGTWKSQSVWYGIKEGMIKFAPFHKAVPAEVVDTVEAVRLGVASGEIIPFSGPIKNQGGEVVVAEGESLSDAELLKMDWYVEGVKGRLP